MSKNVLQALKKVVMSRINTPGHESLIKTMRVISGDKGSLRCELDITSNMLNAQNTLHGGFTATLVDCVSSYAFTSVGKGNFGVSVDLSVSFLKPAFENDTVIIQADILQCGKTLGMATVEIFDKKTGKLIAHGKQTKFMQEKPTSVL